MTLDSETIHSRFSLAGRRSSTSGPSRTSSSKHYRDILEGHSESGAYRSNSCNASSLSERSLGSSRGAVQQARSQNHTAQDSSSVDWARTTQTGDLGRNYSFAGSGSSGDTTPNVSGGSISTRSFGRPTKLKRWAEELTDWDGLRRDPELWFEDGDCFVHLYARGQSRRGPSFCVPFDILRQYQCGAMFSLCFAQMTPIIESAGTIGRRVSSGLNTPISSANTVELFIPAPEEASKEASYKWHVTTRNFFAFVFGKPIVGNHLGQALVDLQERMHLFRSSSEGQIHNHQEFLTYADNQGYRDYVDRPDHALAMLYFSEHYKLRDLWIDAFVHCVGMNEKVGASAEFEPISRLTKALITRAYLEMDIHLGRVMLALSNFLEDDLSPSFLGLSDGGRAHLDRFRSFLYSFYVEKFGYWPPPRGVPFSKALYMSMYFDFKNLHDYLVDVESSADLSMQKPASGGICVLQNVAMFDRRHDFTPLPNPLPLMPACEPMTKRTQSQKALRTLTLTSKQSRTDKYTTTRAALSAATNSRDIMVATSPIVQAFARFEKQCVVKQREEKVSLADARKIRWLLIYGTLQYLISAIQAPPEVRDTENSTYPLCCLIADQSPWQQGTKALNSPSMQSLAVSESIRSNMQEPVHESTEHLSPSLTPKAYVIQPDCQVEEYFTHTNSDSTMVEVPAPLRITSPLARNTSNLSLKRLSLSARTSRRNSINTKPSHKAFCEIYVQGYGNGLNEAIVHPAPQSISRSQSVQTQDSLETSEESAVVSAESSPTPRGRSTHEDIQYTPRRERSPCLEPCQIDQLIVPGTPDEQPGSSTSSSDSPFWSDMASSVSSSSSIHGEPLERKNSSAEVSGLLGGFISIDAAPALPPLSSRRNSRRLLSSKGNSPTSSGRKHDFRFGFSNHSPTTDNLERSMDSPSSPIDSSIGVALSDVSSEPSNTQVQPPAAALTYASPAVVDQPRPLSRSLSNPSLLLLKNKLKEKPLRLDIPTGDSSLKAKSTIEAKRQKEKTGHLDIFSALSLGPKQAEGSDTRPSKVDSVDSEASRPVQDIKPAVVNASDIDMQAVVAKASKDRKKGRKSFWRR